MGGYWPRKKMLKLSMSGRLEHLNGMYHQSMELLSIFMCHFRCQDINYLLAKSLSSKHATKWVFSREGFSLLKL